MHTKVSPLRVVAANTALRLKALLDYEDGAEKRTAGDEWLFEGPGTVQYVTSCACGVDVWRKHENLP